MTAAAPGWGPQPLAIVSSSHELGGAEVYLIALAEELGRRLPIVVLLPERTPIELQRGLERAGVEIRTVAGLARRPSLRSIAGLTRALRSLRPALVHINLTDQGDGLAALAAATLARCPATATLHLVIPRSAAWLDGVSRVALRRARRVIGVSQAVGDYLAGRGVTATVIRNGMAAPAPNPQARSELGLEPTAFVVGGVGRLDPQKGWDVLSEAAPEIRKRVPDVRFVVIGEGPERKRLEPLGREVGISFVGYRERAARFIPAFDVMVVPSRYEGLGLVAIEAMLEGVPVVASRVGGLAEVIADTGLLVEPEDAPQLAAAVVELAEDPEFARALADRARRRAEEHFSRVRMVEETLATWCAEAGRPSTLMTMEEPGETAS